ncbi:hypothetical protein QR680_013207 [Steinernema hermaphroditum]|uniref:Uncharacterized protein n=1 Tax=Steinernema hermaphroditum TaxID=289476 RepID=A0AA39I6R0_9BILA|nr:hypothetical protein QR680_013207 [Steinernema hermaphroditum]
MAASDEFLDLFAKEWLRERPVSELVAPYHVHNDFSVILFVSSALLAAFVASPLVFVFVVKTCFSQTDYPETLNLPIAARSRPIAESTDFEDSTESSREHSEATLVEFDPIGSQHGNSLNSTQYSEGG